MIMLSVEPYCAKCHLFEPEVEKTSVYSSDGCVINDTRIFCKYSANCAEIEEYLHSQIKEED